MDAAAVADEAKQLRAQLAISTNIIVMYIIYIYMYTTTNTTNTTTNNDNDNNDNTNTHIDSHTNSIVCHGILEHIILLMP